MVWHETGIASDSASSLTLVEREGKSVLLVHAGGSWFAVEDRCSHAGCSFVDDGEIDGGTLICNCHGSEFDVTTGAVLAPPAKTPITTYEVRVSSGALEVNLDS